MLHDLTQDGTLTWHCQAREYEDDPPCGILNTCSLDDVSYREAEHSRRPGRGAVIDLPACAACGAVCSLKADYNWRELYRATLTVVDPETSNCVHALKIPHVLNIFVHHKLHERGKAAYAPVIDMPPQELLEHPSFKEINPSTLSSLWFGYNAVREIAPRELEQSNTLQLLSAPDEVNA